ncbi:hypothetical protein DM01DRAFT_323760 [Hesseltinella vesiculosa]|uniref:Uncharacterized protein n=1 Tax=Hesseltinella vesiculosa TaxID=101127 RepID=A0A1X2GB25_9FUNG|nr:hypothetical protein DM01DRAFT_323760 [Hesseltinella vesiculosa]
MEPDRLGSDGVTEAEWIQVRNQHLRLSHSIKDLSLRGEQVVLSQGLAESTVEEVKLGDVPQLGFDRPDPAVDQGDIASTDAPLFP